MLDSLPLLLRIEAIGFPTFGLHLSSGLSVLGLGL